MGSFELTPESTELPASTRAKLIDLYSTAKRCQEEVVVVREEMASPSAWGLGHRTKLWDASVYGRNPTFV